MIIRLINSAVVFHHHLSGPNSPMRSEFTGPNPSRWFELTGPNLYWAEFTCSLKMIWGSAFVYQFGLNVNIKNGENIQLQFNRICFYRNIITHPLINLNFKK